MDRFKKRCETLLTTAKELEIAFQRFQDDIREYGHASSSFYEVEGVCYSIRKGLHCASVFHEELSEEDRGMFQPRFASAYRRLHYSAWAVDDMSRSGEKVIDASVTEAVAIAVKELRCVIDDI